jgi:PAS domain S-box-containing protein
MAESSSQAAHSPVQAEPDQARALVGVVASAGGLRALSQLLAGLPADCPASFLVVQHHRPDRSSLLSEMLRDSSGLAVHDMRGGQTPLPGAVYVAPAGVQPELAQGVFSLAAAEPDAGPAPSLDRFLASLAREAGPRAVAVMLSGNGTDGVLGLRTVQDAGGVTLVQSEATCHFAGMPQAAQEAGAADLVLAPEQMGRELAALWEHSYLRQGPESLPLSAEEREWLLELLAPHGEREVQRFRPELVQRRTARRLALRRAANAAEYLGLLQASQRERSLLTHDLATAPRAFFQPREGFLGLVQPLRELVARKLAGGELRMWVPGCGSGEEAYSLALLAQENLDYAPGGLTVRTFATDLAEDALLPARRGRFPLGEAAALSPFLETRYFRRLDGHLEVGERLRSQVHFSVHDLTRDPPPSRLDVVCSHHRLPRLRSRDRREVLERIHQSLEPGGILFVDPELPPEELAGLFQPLDPAWGLHRRPGEAEAAARPPAPAVEEPDAELEGRSPEELRALARKLAGRNRELVEANRELEVANQSLLDSNRRMATLNQELQVRGDELAAVKEDLENVLQPMGLPLVIVDTQLRIKRFTSSARKIFYLVSSDVGRPLAEVGSRVELPQLREWLHTALERREVVEGEVATGSEVYAVRVFPSVDHYGRTAGAVLIFMDKTELAQAERGQATIGAVARLFMASEDLEQFFAELPRVLASHLEAPYVLVELYQSRSEEMVLKGSAGLSPDQAGRRYRLAGTLAGRVVDTGEAQLVEGGPDPALLSPPLEGHRLATIASAPIQVKGAVLGAITLADHRSRPDAGRLLPVLEAVGINAGQGIERRRAQLTILEATAQALKESQDRYRNIVETANEGIWIVDRHGVTVFANSQMADLLGFAVEEMVGREMWQHLPPEQRDRARRRWRRRRQGVRELYDQRMVRKDGSRMWALISATPLRDESGEFAGSLAMVTDITLRKRAERQLLEHRKRLQVLTSELTRVEERERRRIASDLHDGVGHLLAACKMKVDMILAAEEFDPEALEDLLGVIDQAIATTRSLISDLSPPVLYEMGLESALEWLSDRVEGLTGVKVSVEAAQGLSAELSNDTKIVLFRAASELVNNVVKHSGATRARLVLQREDGHLCLAVEDNGKGFKVPEVSTESFGIFSIRERMSALGGRLELESQPEQGTRATLVLPLDTIQPRSD